MTVRDAGNDNDPPAIVAPTWLEFQIKVTKLSVPVVTLSTENDKKVAIINYNYLVDPTFTKVNRLFFLSFKRIALILQEVYGALNKMI